jgi:hypothetical protein
MSVSPRSAVLRAAVAFENVERRRIREAAELGVAMLAEANR